MARRTLLIAYIATYPLAVGSIIRYLVGFRDDRFLSIALLLDGYVILLFSEPFLVRRNRLLTYTYLFVQTAIICTLSSITPTVDFWAALFCPLVVQVMHNFPQRTVFLLTGIFTVITMGKVVAAERNRLARELHDSVTQSLYGLTLLAAAGQRMIQATELQQIAGNQARLGEIAQQALRELRLLVYELRPLALESKGLISCRGTRVGSHRQLLYARPCA